MPRAVWIGTAQCIELAEIRLRGETLLVAACTEPEVAYWHKVLHQGKTPALVLAKLHQGEHAAASRLRQFAERLGMLSRGPPKSDADIIRFIEHAIRTGQISAVLLTEQLFRQVQVAAKAPQPQFAQAIKAPPPPAVDIARMSSLQRMKEMLWRSRKYMPAALWETVKEFFSPRSLEILAAALVALALAQAAGVGEVVDVALAGWAYYTAGMAGLRALRDIIGALVQAIRAQRDYELEDAAKQFAGALIVLGVSFLTVVMLRQARAKRGGTPEGESAGEAPAKSQPPPKTEPAPVKPTPKRLRRPYIRKAVRDEVEARAPRTKDGRFIDPNTGKPIDGKPDFGHKAGNEFWREREAAEAEGLTQKQFNDRMNNPDKYQLEDPSSNRSHRYEQK